MEDAPMPERSPAVHEAAQLMLTFAERTGVSSARTPERYLWTDAFAVCNLLALAHATGERDYTTLALRLIEQVHHVLGQHRPDDARAGWLSGLGERDGESHPTLAGLRIGKPLRERARDEALDPRLEWDRDGQYFHYLTKWMHALDQASRWTREPRFNAWARELASAAHRAFVHRTPDGSLRMFWKVSIDLARPLVGAMGQHDPLDGFVTCAQLRETALSLPDAPAEPSLDAELADFACMIEPRALPSDDPLGLGGLLMDVGRIAQLIGRGSLADDGLLEAVLVATRAGLDEYAQHTELAEPAAGRLAFRELGLSIGLRALEHLPEPGDRPPPAPARRARLEATVDRLRSHLPLAAAIESFWLDPAHRENATWSAHRDIDDVMLASSLVPEGCLSLSAP
jgi:hypothetical protein